MGWTIDSVIENKKGLINIQNTDGNECFKWCLLRYLYPEGHNPKTRKAGKLYGGKLDFKDIKFQVNVRDIYKNVL